MASQGRGERLAVPRSGDCERVLALVTDAFGGYGGIAQYNRDFLHAASQSRLFGSILVVPRLAPLAVGELPPGVRQVAPIKARLFYAGRALLAALRERPTIIYNGHLFHSPLAFLLARLTGAKLVSQLHGTEVWEPIPRSCRKALEASDLVLTVSRDTRAKLLAQVRIAPEKVAVVNNTFGQAFYPGDRPSARRRFGLKDDAVVLTVARLDGRGGYKGHERVIRQIPRLCAKGHSVTYLVAGIGPDRGRLEQLVDQLGVSKNVRFLGMIEPNDLPDLYRAADLFALPSTGEGFGIAFIEAIACGTPAIGLAVGGAADALADGELGACVSERDFPDALEAAIVKCQQPPQQLAQEVDRRFGRAVFVQAIAAQLALLLDPGHRAASNPVI